MIRVLGIIAGIYALCMIFCIICLLRSDDENDRPFGPPPTGPEEGKGVLITQTMLSRDEQWKSHDE